MKQRELAAYWNGPMGLLRVLIEVVVSAAVDGGMPASRADDVFDELTKDIEKQDCQPYYRHSCTNNLSTA